MNIKSNWRWISISIIGCLILGKIIYDIDRFFVFDFFIYLIAGGTFIILFLINFYKDTQQFASRKSFKNFTPTFAGIFFISAFFLTNYILELRDRIPILIRASYDGGYNGTYIDLRKDGTYLITNGSVMGGEFIRGSYELKDTLLIFDKSNLPDVFKSNILSIRPVIYADSTPHNYLFQINPTNHTIIDNEFIFEIVEDNR